MKHGLHIAALLLALVLALPALGLAEAAVETAAQDDPVLFTFDGQEFTLSAVNEELNALLNSGYLDDANDYDSAIENMVLTTLIQHKIAELGLDQFTEEEEAAFLADAQVEWDQAIQDYVNYFITDDTEEARAELASQGEAYYAAYGYSVQALADSLKEQASYDLLQELMVEGKDLTITQEEIDTVYAQWVAEDKEMFGDDAASYELYQNYYGYTICFIPEGYRGILHILLTVDSDLLTAQADAQAAYEESKSDENPDGDAALLAAAEAAQAAVIAAKQDVIDEIYARLAQGEAFQTLIAEYGEDPGMTDPVQSETGYAVHPDSIIWDPAFIAGSFSDKMQQPGDVSDPVVGSYGIHILYYLRDIPGGRAELTDEMSQSIEEYLSNQKLNECYADVLSAWTAEHEIVYNQEAIDAAKAGE